MIDAVWIVNPLGYKHSDAFNEVAISIADSLTNIGNPCIVNVSHVCPPYNKRVLIFGAHMLGTDAIIPDSAIIYQTEQVSGNSAWMNKTYFDILKNHTVWDYSIKNIDRLNQYGIEAKYVPIGYSEHLIMNLDRYSPEIDALFYGSINDRRKSIINSIKSAGINIVDVFNVYGKRRANLIARSKIILNIHYYDSAIFEVFRCAPLIASGKCVLSETGNDIEMESPYYNYAAFSDNLVESCKYLLENDKYKEIEKKALAYRDSRPMSTIVEEVFR